MHRIENIHNQQKNNVNKHNNCTVHAFLTIVK